jgi:aspartate ammonia-lyase
MEIANSLPSPDDHGPDERLPGETWGKWQKRLEQRREAQVRSQHINEVTNDASPTVVEGMLGMLVEQVYNSLDAYKKSPESRQTPDHLKAVLGIFKGELRDAHQLMTGQNRATFNKKHKMVRDMIEVAWEAAEEFNLLEITGENTDYSTVHMLKLLTETLSVLHKMLSEKTSQSGRKRALRVYKTRWETA